MSRVFITATDTDAGKTFVTSGLIRALQKQGIQARAFKPIACGRDASGQNPDVAALLRIQALANPADIALYDFEEATAPVFAARRENTYVHPEKLINWCRARMAPWRVSLLEGVGGIRVPLADGFLVSDWLEDLSDMDVMLVVRSKLGGINHALLSLDKLTAMGRSPRWVVVNDADNQGQAMLDMHIQTLQPYLSDTCQLITLPYGGDQAYPRSPCMDQIAVTLERRTS
ncbi:MAG: dethiobiotin synthase [Mariprofundaceae bacterium]